VAQKSIGDALNLFLSFVACIAAIIAADYAIRDHDPRPQLQVVFSNGAGALSLPVNELNRPSKPVNFTLYLRNLGTTSANGINAYVIVDQEMMSHSVGSGFDFEARKGSPKTYSARKDDVKVAEKRVLYELGTMSETLKPGNYAIGYEIDCSECENEFVGTLQLNLESKR
jgi:hypothetical protein